MEPIDLNSISTPEELDLLNESDLRAFHKIKSIPPPENGPKRRTRTDLAHAAARWMEGKDPWAVEEQPPPPPPNPLDFMPSGDIRDVDVDDLSREQLLALLQWQKEQEEVEDLKKQIRASSSKTPVDPHAEQHIRVKIFASDPTQTGKNIPFGVNGDTFLLNTQLAGDNYQLVKKKFITGPLRDTKYNDVSMEGDPATGQVKVSSHERRLFTVSVHPQDAVKYFPEEMEGEEVAAA